MTTWNRLLCSQRNNIINAESEKSARRKHRSKNAPPPKRSWTQPDLDNAIREYKAQRASTYDDLVEGVKQGRKGAKKAAHKLFGRNVVATALGVKSRSMVSKSPVWQEIKEDLKLQSQSKKCGPAPSERIGLDIALEKQAEAESSSVIDEVIRRETIELVEKSMPEVEAKATIEKLHRGVMTDDQARELIKVFSNQTQDDRTHKNRQGI